MNRLDRSKTIGLLALAAVLGMASVSAGEQPAPPLPRPGLEVFDGAIPPAPPAQFTPPAPDANRAASRYGDPSGGSLDPTAVVDSALEAAFGQPAAGSGVTDATEAGGVPQAAAAGAAGAQRTQQQRAAAEARRRESEKVDLLSDPTYSGVSRQNAQPAYRPPDLRRAPVPPVPPQAGPVAAGGEARQYDARAGVDPYAGQGGELPYGPQVFGPDYGPEGGVEYGPPPAGRGFPNPFRRRAAQEQFDQGPDYNPMPEEAYFPPQSAPPPPEAYGPPREVLDVLSSLNTRNRAYPGLGMAVVNRDLPGAGGIIWDVLRSRQTIDTALSHGPRWSQAGGISPYELEQLHRVINQIPDGPEDPLATAQRVNVILDAFHTPAIGDPSIFGASMPAVLERLHTDINTVRDNLHFQQDDGVFLELTRTWLRAALSCDFFTFTRRDIGQEVAYVMERGGGMFYPDGSSRGGDVAGITGNLFLDLFRLSEYSREFTGYWKGLEQPARYLQEVMLPDRSLPRFGPQGTREVTAAEVARLSEMFPLPPSRGNHPGLPGSYSFPSLSDYPNLGGIYVLRDRKGPDSRYLAVRFGAPSSLTSVPTHEDFGSIVLASRGQRYFGDPGGYGGAAASAAAHSVLSLDGKFSDPSSYPLPGEPSNAAWRTNASLDYAADQARLSDGKLWHRGVLYVKSLPGEAQTDYWLVLDRVDMQGDPQPRTARIRYVLASGQSPQPDGPGLLIPGGMGGGLRVYAVDAGAKLEMADGSSFSGGQGFDPAITAPSVMVTRQLTGDSTTTTLFYPADNPSQRPARVERDADIIRGKTGAIIIDHGLGRLDVIAWAPPGGELVTPTLNLQLSAELAVFRIRRGKMARIDLVNMQRFLAKEPDGGLWSMRVQGPPQSITIEPAAGGSWQVLSDPTNRPGANFVEANFGPTMTRRRFTVKPGELKLIPR